MRILLSSDVEAHAATCGPKIVNLAILTKAGFPVPAFVGIPSDTVASIKDDATGKTLADVVEEITKHLPVSRYAVRSAALAEDSKDQSFAGQFLTKLHQAVEELPTAIMAVIADAQAKKAGSFSVLVQEFINADVSGVAFSRNPTGGREMVIEYHEGIGEALVSGAIRPRVIKHAWTGKNVHHKELFSTELIEHVKKIETLFGFPQDIEWCVKNGTVHILQSRPITSLSDISYKESLYSDSVLPDASFLFEKTEISEIAPRPTPATFSLLTKIYTPDGPVAKAYSSLGIAYQYRDILKIIGNELYIDREQEIQTMLPSFSHFVKYDLVPRSAGLSGLWTTLKNQKAFAAINPAARCEEMSAMLQKEMEATVPKTHSVQTALAYFAEHYAFIVELNVLAAKALKLLDVSLVAEPVKAAAVLSHAAFQVGELAIPADGTLQGNSLELADTEPFFLASTRSKNDSAVSKWWSGLSADLQQKFEPTIQSAQFYSRARECGRFLTVRLVHQLRNAISAEAKDLGVSKEDMFFVTLEEYIAHHVSHEDIKKRKSTFETYAPFHLPPRLTNVFVEAGEAKPIGVSPGTAEGTVVTVDTIATTKGPKILFTQLLSPDLTKYFGDIVGIISVQGGLLSHLAIVAREQGIPVIVGVDTITLGQTVHMDGSTGEIVEAV